MSQTLLGSEETGRMCTRSEVRTAALNIQVYWDAALCRLVNRTTIWQLDPEDEGTKLLQNISNCLPAVTLHKSHTFRTHLPEKLIIKSKFIYIYI